MIISVFQKIVGNMMKKIQEFINKKTPQLSALPLPLIHNMSAVAFIDMMEKSKVLEPKYCRELKDKLVYFFYGKPSYVINTHNYGNAGDFYAPVCLLFDPKKVAIHKAFPFDTGGFLNRYIKANIYGDFSLKEFELDNTYENICDYIRTYFGSNINYYLGKRVWGDKVSRTEKIHYCLLNMLDSSLDDERVRTIEISSKFACGLRDNLLAIILPSELLEDDCIRSFLVEECKVPVYTYVLFKGTTVEGYTSFLMQKVFQLLKENALLPEGEYIG